MESVSGAGGRRGALWSRVGRAGLGAGPTPLCLGGRLDSATPVPSWGPQFPGRAGCELGATSAGSLGLKLFQKFA